MPKIPGARERISTQVPRGQANNSGQALTEALSNFGGTVANIATDINKRRKKMQDLQDFHEKSASLNLDWQNTDQQLQRDLNPDGTLPERKYGTNAEGLPKTYTDVADEFFEEQIPRFSDSMVSDESKQMFMQNALATKDRTLLKADAAVFQMQAKHAQDSVLETARARQKVVANQTSFNLDQATEFANLDFGHINEKVEEGVLTQRQGLEIQRSIQQGYAETILKKLENEGKWVDMLYFLDAGTQGFGQSEKFELLTDEQKKDIKDRTNIDFDANPNRFIGRQMENVASSLSKDLLESYRNKAMRKSGEDTIIARKRLDENLSKFKQQAYKGEINLNENPKEIKEFKDLMESLRSQKFPGSRADKARMMFELGMSGVINQRFIAGGFMTESADNRKRAIQELKSQDLDQLMAGIENIAPETKPLIEELKKKTPATLRSIKNQALRVVSKVDENLTDAYQEDFAGTAIKHDTRLRGFLSRGDFQNYFSRAELLADSQNIVNPNLVPKNELDKFKQAMEDPNANNVAKAESISKLAMQWGGAWQKVKSEYANQTELAPEIKVASMLVGEAGWSVNDTAQIVRLNKKERQNIFERLPDGLKRSDILAEVNENDTASSFKGALEDTFRTLQMPSGTVNSFLDIIAADAADGLTEDADESEAVEKATARFISRSFSITESENSTIYVPKTKVKGNQIQAIQKFIEDSEGDEGLVNLRKYFVPTDRYKEKFKNLPDTSDEELIEGYYNALSSKGGWVTAPDGSGLIFSSPFETAPLPMRNGNIVLTWEEILGE